jgi:hypothetical protein
MSYSKVSNSMVTFRGAQHEMLATRHTLGISKDKGPNTA